MMRAALLPLALLLLYPGRAAADWQIRPFSGITFGGGTTFVDLAGAAGSPNILLGVNAALLSDVLGLEVDLGHAPGFFQSGDDHLVQGSSATTLTGNVIIALPRHKVEYTLGPYLVAGFGMVHATIDDTLGVLAVDRSLPAIDVGGGVTGFLSKRIGLNWEARYFSSVSRNQAQGVSFGTEKLSFWRASMGLVVRY